MGQVNGALSTFVNKFFYESFNTTFIENIKIEKKTNYFFLFS